MNPERPSDRVIIFDTTLRDGEQSPGASMNTEQKLRVAQALCALGVDVIELGFPVASPGDFDAVSTIARSVSGPTLCALARANREDIDLTWRALKDAERRRIHVFLATSPLHREFKLRMSKDEVLERSAEAVAYARERFTDVQFSAEDAARTEPEFLAEVIERVIAAGATTINIPDTVGYAVPSQFASLLAFLRANVKGSERIVYSVHCHNDLGLAVANSLAAVNEGARQIECTINGLGERAGNCALEEVVMALRTRHDFYGLKTGVVTERLFPTSQLVSTVTGMQVQRNKAIVGLNAFAHEAGIHQHGVLANRATYEIMRAEDVGFSSNKLVLGKHSGRHLLRQRVKELGYDLDDAKLGPLFEAVKLLADRQKEIHDADLRALIEGSGSPASQRAYTLQSLTQTGTADGAKCVSITLLRGADGRVVKESATATGSLEATIDALSRVLGVSARLTDYHVQAEAAPDAVRFKAIVELDLGGRRTTGRAEGTDPAICTAEAVLEALTRMAPAHVLPQPLQATA